MASFPGKGSQTGSRGAAATRYTATPPATRPHFAHPPFSGITRPRPWLRHSLCHYFTAIAVF